MNAKIITIDDIKRKAPSILTTDHKMSLYYKQINTMDMIDTFAEADYFPVDVSQYNPTRRDPRYIGHSVVLRHIYDIENNTKGEACMQIVMLNSHNGRNALRMTAGMYRFVCANGLIIGDEHFTKKLRHVGNAAEEAMNFAKMLMEEAPRMNELIRSWQNIEVSQQKANEFARDAGKLQWGKYVPFSNEEILKARRPEDEGSDMWRLFNRVQENVMRGGLVGESISGRRTTSRGLSDIRGVDFNAGLWTLAETYVKELADA